MDLNDPNMAQFLRGAGERIASMIRARGAALPPAAIEQFARVATEHLAAHPRDKTFYNISGTQLATIVGEVERKLPGGRSDPRFSELVAARFREVLEREGGGPSDPAASA